MAFWLTVLLLTLVVLAILAFSLLRQSGSDLISREDAEQEVIVYRDQLRELDRDLARGVISPEEADRTRVEISRRLLAADKAAANVKASGTAPKSATYAVLLASMVLFIGGGYTVYRLLGVNVPGQVTYNDLPLSDRIEMAAQSRENRPSQAEIEATLPAWEGPPEGVDDDYMALITRLREAVASRPDDYEGNELLALHEARLGNFVAAHEAKARAIAALGGEAKAGDYAQLVDLMVLATDGYVSPEAETALQEVMQRDPDNLVGRYYSGLMFAQTGRPDIAFPLWRDLLTDSPQDAPWVDSIRSQIGQLAGMAGVNYTLPPVSAGRSPLAGPDAAALAAAADMTDEERAAMIEGMVGQLMERLAAEGGSAQEWARLITALGALGRVDRATAIWREAQDKFAGQPENLGLVNSAASNAGLGRNTATTAPASDPSTDANAIRMRELDNRATNLADQLGSEGGPSSVWAELIAVLAEMNETDKAIRVWTEAQKAFAESPDDLAALQSAAESAGLVE